MTTTILLDIDGVLADFVGHVLRLVHKENIVVDRWDFHDQLGMTAKELWDAIDNAGHNFWATIPKLPWADSVIDVIHTLGLQNNTILCTSPSPSYQCNSGKIQWIHENFSVFDRKFILTPCKHMLRGDYLLIDDNDGNCLEFAKINQPSVLFPQLWNANCVLVDKIDRIDFLYNSLKGLL